MTFSAKRKPVRSRARSRSRERHNFGRRLSKHAATHRRPSHSGKAARKSASRSRQSRSRKATPKSKRRPSNAFARPPLYGGVNAALVGTATGLGVGFSLANTLRTRLIHQIRLLQKLASFVSEDQKLSQLYNVHYELKLHATDWLYAIPYAEIKERLGDTLGEKFDRLIEHERLKDKARMFSIGQTPITYDSTRLSATEQKRLNELNAEFDVSKLNCLHKHIIPDDHTSGAHH